MSFMLRDCSRKTEVRTCHCAVILLSRSTPRINGHNFKGSNSKLQKVKCLSILRLSFKRKRFYAVAVLFYLARSFVRHSCKSSSQEEIPLKCVFCRLCSGQVLPCRGSITSRADSACCEPRKNKHFGFGKIRPCPTWAGKWFVIMKKYL